MSVFSNQVISETKFLIVLSLSEQLNRILEVQIYMHELIFLFGNIMSNIKLFYLTIYNSVKTQN